MADTLFVIKSTKGIICVCSMINLAALIGCRIQHNQVKTVDSTIVLGQKWSQKLSQSHLLYKNFLEEHAPRPCMVVHEIIQPPQSEASSTATVTLCMV